MVHYISFVWTLCFLCFSLTWSPVNLNFEKQSQFLLPQGSTKRGCVVFNLDPSKIGSPRNEFFWNIWTHSEKFVPTIAQPHKRKSVTTKDISRVHSCTSRELNDCVSWVCLSSPMQRSKRAFVTQWMRKLSVTCGREWDYSTLELTGLSSFQKPQETPNFACEIRSALYHLWEVV